MTKQKEQASQAAQPSRAVGSQEPGGASRWSADEYAVIHSVQRHYDTTSFDCMSDVVLEQVHDETLLGEVGRYFETGRWRRVADIGCGASARNPFFVRRYWRLDAVAVDISRQSLERARERIAVPYVNGSVLALPFRDEAFDFVISTGVIHHTPSPWGALQELARVTKRGGGMFVSIYNRRSIYRPLYRYLGAVFRALNRSVLKPLLRWIVVPLYALAYTVIVWIAVRRRVSVPYRQAEADFADKFLTPYVEFVPAEQVEAWIAAEGLTCLRTATHMAAMMVGFLIRR
jgi:ubiquinone/menaquinone biosynthesis C-methylase UbiE